MARTLAEKQISHARKRQGILVPLLEDFMRRPVNIESHEDVGFLKFLLGTMAERERRRSYDGKVFSPSSLASCLRQVYLSRHHEELGIPKRIPLRVEPNFYFLNGNFLHIKWQFALFKMAKAINDPKIFQVWGYEVPIMSKRKDHGGTVDVIAQIYGRWHIIDFKGLNVRTFGEITRGYLPVEYTIQLTDYMALWNSRRGVEFQIEDALLIAENKGGPDPKHPIALHETVINKDTAKPEVRRRLKELREHEANKEIPEPECDSTTGFQFVGCPFSGFCKPEVAEIQRRRKRREGRKAAEVAVARPSRPKRKPRGMA
jgi:hypothetical protein